MRLEVKPQGTRAFLAAAGLALVLSGCVSSDVSGDAKTRDEVVLALPTNVPAPDRILRAIWFPNGSSFEGGDWSPLGHPVGVLVLAGKRLWFLTWNSEERHFDVQRTLTFLTAERVSVTRLGGASMLVVESGNRASDAFELMEGGQVASDPKTTQELCDQMQAIRARTPQPAY
jgi:hypothetical protein